MQGGARGPGVFFIIPCLDVYQKIDMRTATYDVPPQEVRTKLFIVVHNIVKTDPKDFKNFILII